jgi:hypothetical protein
MPSPSSVFLQTSLWCASCTGWNGNKLSRSFLELRDRLSCSALTDVLGVSLGSRPMARCTSIHVTFLISDVVNTAHLWPPLWAECKSRRRTGFPWTLDNCIRIKSCFTNMRVPGHACLQVQDYICKHMWSSHAHHILSAQRPQSPSSFNLRIFENFYITMNSNTNVLTWTRPKACPESFVGHPPWRRIICYHKQMTWCTMKKTQTQKSASSFLELLKTHEGQI